MRHLDQRRRLAAVTMSPEAAADLMGLPDGTLLVHADVDMVSHRVTFVFEGPDFEPLPAGVEPVIGVLFRIDGQTFIDDFQTAGALKMLAKDGMTGMRAVEAFRAWRQGPPYGDDVDGASVMRVDRVLREAGALKDDG